ncbi:MAG TPA: V-type ATP synthase subunit D [Gaiellaceae bacterium]|nr:V-type ATP synthase subunit D [Gaiellaceae bacterium]
MALRLPPGRAGRLWLLHRIDAARRGGEVLDQKRQALLREEARLRGEVGRAEAEWRERAAEAAVWLQRAAVLGGERALGLASFYSGGTAEVELVWRNTLGVRHPAEARLSAAAPAPPFLGTPALVPAAAAHRRALEAAARLGAVSASHRRVAAELDLTARRLRTIERRWLPDHEEALQELELRLDEDEREELARVRWTVGRDHRFAPDRTIR